jgi:hydroxypyruvate isomerase
MVFADRPFEERLASVARAGIGAIEYWTLPDKDIGLIDEQRRRHNLKVAAFGLHPWGGLVRDVPAAEMRDAAARSIGVARRLGCPNLLGLVGREVPGLSRQEMHDNIVRNMQVAAPMAEDAGITLLVEPLNVAVDHPGFYLSSSQEALQIVEEVGGPYVKMLYDLYHMQISEGNLTATIIANLDRIGHFHLADVPGRHEPGTGEINFAYILRRIDKGGYGGYVGLEYKPSGDAFESLGPITDMVAAINREEQRP